MPGTVSGAGDTATQYKPSLGPHAADIVLRDTEEKIPAWKDQCREGTNSRVVRVQRVGVLNPQLGVREGSLEQVASELRPEQAVGISQEK